MPVYKVIMITDHIKRSTGTDRCLMVDASDDWTERILPVAGDTLRWCVAVVINRIEKTALGRLGVIEVIKCCIKWQTGAHPQEHARSEAIARRPEIVFAVASVGQILAHRFHLFFRLKWCQLQAKRSAILIGQEVVKLRWVWIHSAHKVLDAIELDCGNSLTFEGKMKKNW